MSLQIVVDSGGNSPNDQRNQGELVEISSYKDMGMGQYL